MAIKSKNEAIQTLKGAMFKYKMIDPLINPDKNLAEFLKRIDAILNEEFIQWVSRHSEDQIVAPRETLNIKSLKHSLSVARIQRRQALQKVLEEQHDKEPLADTVSEWDKIIANIEFKIETLA